MSAARGAATRRTAGLLLVAATGAACSGSPHGGPTAPTPTPSPSLGPQSVSDAVLRSRAANGLKGIGEPVAAYKADHDGRNDGYGPGLSVDGLRVVAFTRTFRPAVSSTEVGRLLHADLPSDTTRAADLHPSAGCEQLWFASALLRDVQGAKAYVSVSLTSAGATYDPAAVTRATLDTDLLGGPGSQPC